MGMKILFAIKVLILLTGVFFFHCTVNAHVEQPKDLSGIGIDERLGQFVPLDLTFNDENGDPVTLKQLIHTPIILTPVYLHCPNVCSLLLQNLADVLNRLPAEPDKEYKVISISFDETEKPDLALQKKKTYLKMIEKPFPEDAWRFLTGDKENIRQTDGGHRLPLQKSGRGFRTSSIINHSCP